MVENRQTPAMMLIRRGRSTMKIDTGANFRWWLIVFALIGSFGLARISANWLLPENHENRRVESRIYCSVIFYLFDVSGQQVGCW